MLQKNICFSSPSLEHKFADTDIHKQSRG